MLLHGRSKGRFIHSIIRISIALLEGKTAAIMSPEQSTYIDRVIKELAEMGIRNVKYQVLTTTTPLDNIQLEFDIFGEPVGVEILPQNEKFIGWKLWIES